MVPLVVLDSLPWFHHDFLLFRKWFLHGFNCSCGSTMVPPMVPQFFPHDFFIILQMVPPWHPNSFTIIPSWFPQWFIILFPWFHHDCFIVPPLYNQWFLNIFPVDPVTGPLQKVDLFPCLRPFSFCITQLQVVNGQPDIILEEILMNLGDPGKFCVNFSFMLQLRSCSLSIEIIRGGGFMAARTSRRSDSTQADSPLFLLSFSSRLLFCRFNLLAFFLVMTTQSTQCVGHFFCCALPQCG